MTRHESKLCNSSVAITFVFLVFVSALISACGNSATASGTGIIMMQTAPDGATCYVLYDGGGARGISCH